MIVQTGPFRGALNGSPTGRRRALRWLLTAACCATAAAACGGSRPTEPDSSAFPQKPGFYQRTLSPRNLRYTIAIPNSFKGDQPTPLILALHFGGPVTPFYGGAFLDALVGPALQDLEAILVAPDAVTGTWSSPQSEANVLELLDVIGSNYRIDPRRTLVTGYSMGGAGTWYLAARNQKRFRGAVPVSGRPQDEAIGASWEIPIYAIHSRQDEVIPFASAEAAINQLKAKGVAVELVAVDGITHFETTRFILPLRAAIPWIQNVWK